MSHFAISTIKFVQRWCY